MYFCTQGFCYKGRIKPMKDKFRFILGRIREGRIQEMLIQTKWIYQYARKHWLAMIFYTVLGMAGTVIALITSMVSKDLIDIITGHETGKIVQPFAFMICLNIVTTIVGQISNYASSWISMIVDAEIKSDILMLEKM